MSAIGKVCTRCQGVKPLEAFKFRGDGSDKRHPWCRECARAEDRARHKRNYVPTGYPRGPRERWLP